MEAQPTKPRRANELGPTGLRLAENLKRAREDYPMTTAELARRVTALGRTMLANTITKVEKGTRRVDVDDLVAISVALDTRPDALLLPPVTTGSVQLTDTKTVTAVDAWLWANGRQPLDLPDDDDGTAHNLFQMRAQPSGLRSFRRTFDVADGEA